MKKYLLFFLTMLTTTLGAWAQTTYFGSGENNDAKSSVTINVSNAQFLLKNASDFLNWFSTGDFATTLSGISGENITFKSESGSDNLALDAISIGENSTLVLTVKDQWNFQSPKATITLNAASHLATWYSDATNGTKNWQLLDCIDLTNLTFAGTAPTISLTSGTITLATENGKIKGTISNGTTYSDFSTWKSSVENHHFFSNSAYCININAGGTSYVEVNGTKATVHSDRETDFATWAATPAGAEWLTGLEVTAYNFDNDAKFETDGASNYVVLNGTTATVTSADALTSLDTWMTTHSANGINNYLSDITAYNMASSVTTYLTSASPYITSTSSENTMVVTSSTITVTKDMADFIKWKATNNGIKILAGKTVSFVDCAYTDGDTDPCTITLSSDGLTATVHATTAGHFKTLYETAGANSFLDGTTFVFDNASVVDGTDLAVLLTGNKYYIDLFEITTGSSMTVEAIDNVLKDALVSMTNESRIAKGIILPYNSTLSTSIVCGLNNDYTPKYNSNDNKYLFSEYTAYFRSAGVATIHAFDHQVQYSTERAVTEAQAHVEKALSQLNSHSTVTSNVTTYLASTNNTHDLDLSSITGKTTVSISNDEMVFATHGLANIVATLNTAGDFSNVVTTTNIEQTPCERITISGPVNSTDMTAVNSFAISDVDSPKTLILSGATGLTTAMLTNISNDDIQYVVLPGGWSKSDVSSTASYTGMANLKAAISSTNLDLVAYVKEAGSLAEARYYATGGTKSTINVGGTDYSKFDPAIKGLVNVTLTGQLNASDLAANVGQGSVVSVADGHLYSDATFEVTGLTVHSATANGYTTASGKTAGSSALGGEHNTIKSLDLADATFENQYDMNFNLLGLTVLHETHLPTSSSMTTLPIGCFKGNKSMDYLCIPSNYTTIGRYAVADNTVTCITTDNASHTLVVGAGGKTYLSDAAAEAGCPNTFTFSQYVTYIGEGAFAINNEVITDVYVLATTPPTCEVNSFSSGTTYGWGGFDGTLPYCREKYVNSGNKMYTVLHYPHKGTMTDAAYEEMEKKYTDITKIYTKKEQTGAVDANGRPILWPTLTEINRVYNQGTTGLTWYDWDTAYDGNQAVNAESTYTESFTKTLDADASKTYDFDDYKGWHQFVLTLATHIDRDETVVNNKIERNYVDAGWFTFCIPFDMTIGQVINMLGVPASDETYTNKLEGSDVGSSPVIPDIRQLRSVIRTNGDANNPNKVTFRLTTNLYNSGTPQYLTFNHDAAAGSVIGTTSAQAEGSVVGQENSRCLVGGHPYIIHVYKREGESIPKYNLGQYIMNHYADEFKQTASCINNGNYEWLGDGNVNTLKFAKPFEDHKIQAAADADPSTGYATDQWLTYDDGGTSRKYHYAFVGQFWEQPLPRYCIYQSQGTWYRNSTANNYKWAPYKCVIMAVPFVTDSYAKSGKFRDESRSQRPTISGTDLLDKELKIGFADGRDDDDFVANARYTFAFDDGIMEYDENGDEVTAIDRLDGEDFAPMPSKVKIYNMAGQYVGDSLESLGGGLYIVNGKKIMK